MKNYTVLINYFLHRLSSSYWTNNKTYAVENGLECLTEKQTKLASYWNTPFKKICLGMKVNDVAKWIVINHQATSLFNVIADGVFKNTAVRRGKLLSLMNGLLLQENYNLEGFNIDTPGYSTTHLKVRIGIIANNQNNCETCNSCIGFGTSIRGCKGEIRKIRCGNIAICNQLSNKNTAAFGYVFVQ